MRRLELLFGGGRAASLIPCWAQSSGAWRQVVAVTTLDTLLDGRFQGQRMVVKIDVEEAETALPRGAAGTLARAPSRVWIVEVCFTENLAGSVNPGFREVVECFWARGYMARSVKAHGRLVISEDV